MIDQFVIGTVERISPEAPVPIVRFDHDTWRLGGAANVANNIIALGGHVDAVGIVGHDADGARLLEDLAGRSITTGGVVSDPSRCTTRKLRVVTTRNQQVARIDYEADAAIDAAIETAIIRRIGELAGQAHAIVVSDYMKGVVTAKVAAAAADAARAHRIPLLVDPKVPAYRALCRRDIGDAESHRSRIGDAHADSHGRRRARGGAAVPRTGRQRSGAHHARRTRHVAAGKRR